MAKSTKSEKSERQKVIDDIRRKQKSAEKRQGFLIVGICLLAAVIIVGIAAYNPVRTWLEQRKYDDEALADIGGPASVCRDVEEKPASGSAQHVQPAQVEYEDAPPAFGDHWLDEDSPAGIEKRYYTADDRPELESLVHNLEHGFTILWYDETAADDAETVGEVKAIADRLNDSDTNNRLSFIAAPWTDEDGGEFPDGQHIALTHWRVGDDDKQYGVWQYCSEPSGEALEAFMKEYPYTDAPEPIGGYTGGQ